MKPLIFDLDQTLVDYNINRTQHHYHLLRLQIVCGLSTAKRLNIYELAYRE